MAVLRAYALALACVTWLAASTVITAQAAEFPLCDNPTHDLGIVQRGSKHSHRFVLTNRFSRSMRVRGVRVSCGCTRASASGKWFEPGEQAIIDAVMDTSGFEGPKTVTIYVTIDRPRSMEIPLRLSVISATAPSIETRAIEFGMLHAGEQAQREIHLDNPGNINWRIVDLDHGNPHFDVEVQELQRSAELVRYVLRVSIRPDATPGLHTDQIRVHTNDQLAPRIPVVARAKIQPDLVVSPESIRLEDLAPGSKHERKLIVRSTEPFKIVRASNTQEAIEVHSTPDARTVQVAVVSITIPDDPSLLPDHVDLQTDLDGGQIVSVRIER